jgi:hypothetical protein
MGIQDKIKQTVSEAGDKAKSATDRMMDNQKRKDEEQAKMSGQQSQEKANDQFR